ncbi:DUF2267 domain-containing protein [Roseibium marinum]|uniref:Uncharacterized protein (DUF2267 family) n=1 Tax=Roseibium marinum TaxID=281252 RepID=A0A2S3UK37_9HYPH|nr:DUF2267 domain-containing protein [Roseibium marinum]POF28078.1 uncharacterized protein (DUF2267 family) [Roseibium marinum]
MPMPQTYFHASLDFDAFLQDVRDTCMLQTHHQAYHTLRAVLHTFRAHLTTEQALEFANILPAVTRAIFVEDWVEDWQPGETPPPFPDRVALTRKVKFVRQDHNMAPDTAIADVATALRRSSVDERQLDRVLARLPEGAVDFWNPHV